jgi:hypothetical protein
LRRRYALAGHESARAKATVFQIKNYTGGLEHGQAFLRAKLSLVDTRRLSIHVKHTFARKCDVTGYYRWDDRRIVLAVRPGLEYPLKASYDVALAPRKDGRSGFSRNKIWFEEVFRSEDDLFVFVAGHEIWHFLCDSRQRPPSLDREALANRLGFLWLHEFKRWRGPGTRVDGIPTEPPCPAVIRGRPPLRPPQRQAHGETPYRSASASGSAPAVRAGRKPAAVGAAKKRKHSSKQRSSRKRKRSRARAAR